MRLVDAESLLTDIMMLPHNGDMISSAEVEQAILDAPTIEAEPVTAEWIPFESDYALGYKQNKTWYKCSECGREALGRCEEDEWYSYPILLNFCPHCGKMMKGAKT